MRVAVLGLGFMGSTHLKALQGIEGVEVAAVCSRDEKALAGDFRGVQGNLGGPGELMDFSAVRKYREIDQAIADPDIDAVDLCLPTSLHAPAAIGALRAGKHVLVEKPMALDGITADQMIAEAASAGKILMTAQVLRFMPPYAALRVALKQGGLGPMRSAVFRRRCAAPVWGGWLQRPELSGGGVFDLLIHDVDMMLHLFGKPERAAATGFEDNARGVDIIHAQFQYSNGIALVAGGWHHPKSYPFSMEFTVVSDGGTVDFSSLGRAPTLYREDGSEEKLALEDHDGYAAEIRYFVQCCNSGEQPELCAPRESADAVRLARWMLEARDRNGEWIECNL